MSALGQTLLIYSASGRTFVRYTPNSDHFAAMPKATKKDRSRYFLGAIGVERATCSSAALSALSFISRRTRRDLILGSAMAVSGR
jgi:hypothetical protein